jgi:hypothetical protein
MMVLDHSVDTGHKQAGNANNRSRTAEDALIWRERNRT